MIAIIGVSEDDILYFKAKMQIKEEISLFGGVDAYVGSIYREEVVLCAVGESNYRSAMISSILLDRFDPYLVFTIGACYSFKRELRQGDILIVDRIYFAGINYTAEHRDVHYGQIPGEPPFYVGDIELNDRAEREAYLVTQRYIQRGYLLTGDRFYGTAKEVNETLTRHYLLEEGMRAYDNSSGGIALACHQKKVPTINIRAVALEIGNPDQRLNWRRKGLEAMPTIGKIITRIVLEGGNEEG